MYNIVSNYNKTNESKVPWYSFCWLDFLNFQFYWSDKSIQQTGDSKFPWVQENTV